MNINNGKEIDNLKALQSKRKVFFILAAILIGVGLWFIINMLILLSSGGIVIGASLDLAAGLFLVALGLVFLILMIIVNKKIKALDKL